MTALPDSANRAEDLQALLPWIVRHASPSSAVLRADLES